MSRHRAIDMGAELAGGAVLMQSRDHGMPAANHQIADPAAVEIGA